ADRLGDVVEGAELHRLHGGVGGVVARHHDELAVGLQAAPCGQHVEPSNVGQVHVQQYDVEELPVERLQPVHPGHGDLDGIAGVLEHVEYEPPGALVILGEEYARPVRGVVDCRHREEVVRLRTPGRVPGTSLNIDCGRG